MSLYRLLLLMTVAPMVVSAATHGVNGVGIDYATGALTSLLAFSLRPLRANYRLTYFYLSGSYKSEIYFLIRQARSPLSENVL